jgi:hypothetical protein
LKFIALAKDETGAGEEAMRELIIRCSEQMSTIKCQRAKCSTIFTDNEFTIETKADQSFATKTRLFSVCFADTKNWKNPRFL